MWKYENWNREPRSAMRTKCGSHKLKRTHTLFTRLPFVWTKPKSERVCFLFRYFSCLFHSLFVTFDVKVERKKWKWNKWRKKTGNRFLNAHKHTHSLNGFAFNYILPSLSCSQFHFFHFNYAIHIYFFEFCVCISGNRRRRRRHILNWILFV